jgi:hypothetical protein
MTDDFGTPYTPVEAPSGRNSTPIIIAVVVLVVLCCCCVLFAGGLAWSFGDGLMNYLGVY